MIDLDMEPAARGLSLSGEPLPRFDHHASDPQGATPSRRPGSVRRTMTLDATWPEGRDGPAHFHGTCRDLLTPAHGGAARKVARAHVEVVTRDRVIQSIATTPRRDLDHLVGARAGGHMRAAVDVALPGEKRDGTPLYLMLDDLSGATLVAGWAWWPWTRDRDLESDEDRAMRVAKMTGVCMGFRPGSRALDEEGDADAEPHGMSVQPLADPADADGWHAFADPDEPHFRRARRIDLWREDGLLHVDALFQDSGRMPGGGRLAIHEYRLSVTADAVDGRLRSIDARPGTLPFPECQAAPVNNVHLIGHPLAGLREQVLLTLRRTAGCTHLNDMLRALAEVPALSRHLHDPA